jgi:hypothetical protein
MEKGERHDPGLKKRATRMRQIRFRSVVEGLSVSMRHQTRSLRAPAVSRRRPSSDPLPFFICVVAILSTSALVYWLLFRGAMLASHAF